MLLEVVKENFMRSRLGPEKGRCAMKKLTIMVLVGGMVMTLFANCGRNDNPAGPTNMSAMCYYQQTSTNNNYSYANQPGTPCNYNYSALNVAGFTQANTGGFYQTSGMYGACNNGAQAPVYSPTKGLGCVDSTRLMLSGQIVTYALNQAAQTFVPSSAPSPYYGNQAYGGNNPYGGSILGGSMYGGAGYFGGNSFGANGMLTVLRVCDSVELCPAGQFCRSPIGPTAMNTGVGLCYF
jgi:hypothetical protein